TRRFRLDAVREGQEPYLVGDVQVIDERVDDSSAAIELAETVGALFGEYFRLSLTLAGQWQERIAIPSEPAVLAHFVGARLVVPQAGQKRKITDEQVDRFREGMAAANIGPTFIHGIYLVNLATDRPDILPKSVDSLITDLTHAARIGSAGVIFHVGVFRTPTF